MGGQYYTTTNIPNTIIQQISIISLTQGHTSKGILAMAKCGQINGGMKLPIAMVFMLDAHGPNILSPQNV